MAEDMARSAFRHSSARVWTARHPWVVRSVAVVAVALLASAVTLVVTHKAPVRGGSAPTPTTGPSGALTLSSTVPAANGHVASDAVLSVKLNHSADPSGPMPKLEPTVAGRWHSGPGSTLTFDADAPLVPGTHEILTLPGGNAGLRDSAGHTLAQTVSIPFTVDSSTMRLQQLLALLGYLPVTFTTSGPPPAPKQVAQPQPGSFAWRWQDPLSGLEDHWAAGEAGVLTQGAVMTFQDQHHLTVDGVAGPELWAALLAAWGAGQRDPQPYDYAYVDKTLPQHLTLYVDGVAKFPNIAVNTGLHGADTPNGTYAVFEHVPSSEMKGTNPDGSTYDDPNVPWASYFYQGDALHGFVRATYGSPQSNGCVEMSVTDAGTLWPYTPVGTLVTVVGPPS